MKILFIQNRYWDDRPGGTEQMCQQLGEGLKARGHRIAMLTSRSPEGTTVFHKLWDRLSMLNANWLYRGSPAAGAAWLANHFWNYLVTRLVIKDYGPDVVYVHNSENIQAGPLNASVDSGKRVVIHAHNHLYAQWNRAKGTHSKLGRLIRPKMENAVFMAVSRHMAGALESSGIPSERIATIHNGLPDAIFNIAEGKRKDNSLVFAGHVTEQKGFRVLLEAADIMRKSRTGIQIDAYGMVPKDEFTDSCLRFIEEKKMLQNIRVHGPAPREALWGIFANSEVFAAPSLGEESFGLVAAEAMCCGTIVVASNRGGLPEVVGDAGFLVEPTADEVARACLEALGLSATEKDRLRKMARRRAEERFRFADRLPEYEAVLSGRLG